MERLTFSKSCIKQSANRKLRKIVGFLGDYKYNFQQLTHPVYPKPLAAKTGYGKYAPM